MGRILAIRLSAVTYDEAEVFRAWPSLCALAWPGVGEMRGGEWKPAAVSAALAAPVAAQPARRGVVELARALAEEAALGDWPDARKKALENDLNALEKQLGALEKALGDWQPQAAHAASTALEDILDGIERLIRAE